MRKLILAFIFLLIAQVALAADYTVNQDGAGADYSVAGFNALSGTGYAGDTFNFSGTITSQVYPSISGTSSGRVVLDGTSATLRYNVTDTAYGMIRVHSNDYLTIQNWEIDGNYTTGTSATRWGIDVKGTDSDACTYVTIDSCEIYEAIEGIHYRGNVQNLLITNNNFHDLNGSGVRGTDYLYETTSHTSNDPTYITIGGSSGNGNTCVNVGYLDSTYDTDACFHIDRTSHLVVSYNIGYATKIDWGMTGLYGNEVTYCLVERNIFHDMRSEHHRSLIAFKGDQLPTAQEGPYIIRFNHVWNGHGDEESWGDSTSGISVSANWSGAYIYGNYVHDCGRGIAPNITYAGNHDDGYDCDNLYIIGNIIDTTQFAGIRLEGRPGTTYDKITSAYILNNTIYMASTQDDTLGRGYADPSDYDAYHEDSAISMALTAAQYNLHQYKNNLIIEPRPNGNNYIAMCLRGSVTNFENDYNHYYDSGSSSILIDYWDSTDVSFPFTGTMYAWDSASRPGTDGDHDSVGNPYLTDAAGGDFSLTSSSTDLIDAGTDVGSGNIDTITIHGTNYSVPWDFALGPDTVFHATDPDSIVIDAESRDSVGWDIGAYAYVPGGGDVTPPVVTITTSDPQNITDDGLQIQFTCTDANGISEAKWRMSSEPDASNGTVVSGSSPFSAATSGFSEGANTIYVGCDDPSGNWGSDSITVNLDTDYPLAVGDGIIINGVSHSIVNADARGRNGIGYTYDVGHYLLIDNASHYLLIDGASHKLLIDGAVP